MKEKILIVEDQFVEADYLRILLKKAGYHVTGIAHSVPQAQQLIAEERPDMVLLDIFVKGKQTGIDLAKELARQHIAFVYLSASSNEEVLNAAKATQPYGFLVKPFREKDLLIMLEIARYRHEHSVESVVRKEQILNEKLDTLADEQEDWGQTLLNIGRVLQSHISFDYITAGFNVIDKTPEQALSYLRVGFDEYQQIGIPELLTIAKLKMNELQGLVNTSPMYEMLSSTFGMRSCTSLPLYLSGDLKFTISFYSRQLDTYTKEITDLLGHLKKNIARIIERALTGLKQNAVAAQTASRKEDIVSQQGFAGIVGQSSSLLNVFDLITSVAGSDTSVLVLGESGTGKERIADAIHYFSPRRSGPFIKVNCAALPATLIESELFGHEKGSFTGATGKRIGKFEMADQGTIFLDEIGEMPLDLQVKLLRVLQEKCIERIGARDITKVNVRVIAATNRNLEKEVSEGRFRLDLYYRLNVFPIDLPPLRDRAEDLPLLTAHFIRLFSEKTGKRITGVSDKVARNMAAYSWPGNIRELENMIERSVLLAKSQVIEEIRLPEIAHQQGNTGNEPLRIKTIHENERDYIISVLKKCNGRVWGAGGAAEVMGLPPTTLSSRMKKLGIQKNDLL